MLATIIPEHRQTVKDFVAAHGKDVVGQVTVEQVREGVCHLPHCYLASLCHFV